MTTEEITSKIFEMHGSIKETGVHIVNLNQKITDHITDCSKRDEKIDEMLHDISKQVQNLQSLKITVATVSSGISVFVTLLAGFAWDVFKKYIF